LTQPLWAKSVNVLFWYHRQQSEPAYEIDVLESGHRRTKSRTGQLN